MSGESVSVSDRPVPHREIVFLFSELSFRIGKVPNRFQNARPASGNRVLIFKLPVPHRESHFPFSFGRFPQWESPSKFPLALSRVRIAISDIIWYYPTSGHTLSDFRWLRPTSGQALRRRPSSLLAAVLVHTHVVYLSLLITSWRIDLEKRQ